jgi:predicted nucleic acid-binding protein
MKSNILLDTGLLVAIVNRREAFHQWATQATTNLSYPFFTCEAVITEACFLLQNVYGGEDAVIGLVMSKKIVKTLSICSDVLCRCLCSENE